MTAQEAVDKVQGIDDLETVRKRLDENGYFLWPEEPFNTGYNEIEFVWFVMELLGIEDWAFLEDPDEAEVALTQVVVPKEEKDNLLEFMEKIKQFAVIRAMYGGVFQPTEEIQ